MLVACLLVLLGACGSAPVDVHAAYARIQVAEARIAHAGAEAAPGEPADRCGEICDASEAIMAEALLFEDDADAAVRAERARATCEACGELR